MKLSKVLVTKSADDLSPNLSEPGKPRTSAQIPVPVPNNSLLSTLTKATRNPRRDGNTHTDIENVVDLARLERRGVEFPVEQVEIQMMGLKYCPGLSPLYSFSASYEKGLTRSRRLSSASSEGWKYFPWLLRW